MISNSSQCQTCYWVSHRNHRGNICVVDFIWLLNPDKYKKLLKSSWSEAVFGMFKVQATVSPVATAGCIADRILHRLQLGLVRRNQQAIFQCHSVSAIVLRKLDF